MVLFTTSPFYKILVAIILVVGIGLQVLLFQNFGELAEEQKKTTFLWFLMFAFFFFGIPFYAIRHFKKIERKNGIWTVNYLYIKKKEFVFSKKNIKKILVTERLSGEPGIWYTNMKVELKNGSCLSIRSYETRDFKNLLKLMEKDFKEIVKIDF
jgi:hypothetical protein